MSFSPVYLSAQKGPQSAFLSTQAQIAIYGGAAGGGKTYALLLEPLRHINNPLFGAVIFRRNSTQVRSQGGLWDESMRMYLPCRAHPREAYLDWTFSSGMKVKFCHLELERSVLDHQGAQYPLIGFDELTHFTQNQFFYLLSRNRSMSGVPGYIRATCNPDCDSFVRDLIDWWIDDNGDPIPERSGKLRWFIRQDDNLYWADSRQALIDQFGPDELPKSLTFIPSKLQDNQILMQSDPSYLANLKALSRVERMRLLGGNWNVRAAAGTLFRTEWFPIVNEVPGGWISIMRFWDRGATKPHEGNKDPDWTRGLKLYKYRNGTYCVGDLKSMRDTPAKVTEMIRAVASMDGQTCRIMSQQDPGSAGVMEAEHFVRMLSGYDCRIMVTSKDKVTRSLPVSAQAEVGNILVLRAPWNKEFFAELENFPTANHDDIVDTLSGSFNEMCGGYSILDTL